MTAVDTNVIIRFVTADDPVQSPRARDLIHAGPVWVGKTVLLETQWVLSSVYELSRPQVVRTLRAFLGLPQVAVEDESAVAVALEAYAAGIDFADALHLASAAASARFASFDGELRRRAVKRNLSPPVVEP